MHDDIYGISDIGFDGAIGQVHAALQNAAREAGQGLPCGSCVHGGKASRMSGVEKLQQIEGLATTNFTQDQTIGPMAKRCLQKIPNGDGGQTVLRLPRFETDKVVLAHMNFRGVLNEENTFIAWNEFSEDIEHRGFSRTGRASDQNVFSG